MAIQHHWVNDENNEADAYRLILVFQERKLSRSTQNTLGNMDVMKLGSDDFHQLFKTITRGL